MQILNLHERVMVGDRQHLTELFNQLASPQDRLWPPNWPPLRLSPRLTAGASGGHGPIRYRVSLFAPLLLRCTFLAPRGFDGYHELSAMHDPGGLRVRHLINMQISGPALLTWPLFYRPLHDALMEDLLDRAEQALTGSVQRPARHSGWVRLLRRLGRRLAEAPRHG